ncbi:MAG: methionine--tRNA ligase [Cyanobacteriota bacterium]|nr:methionine--tRNA ligase [Cyanobacteriota bacterium]
MPFTLTTPLYYVNDKPHLGSTYTTLACDAIARYERLRGRAVTFVTGTDEHGLKIQRTAEAAGLAPQAFCDRNSASFSHLWQAWGISQDRFIRTTAGSHRVLVEQFFARVEAKGDVLEGRQQGWYCVACEEFKDDSPDAEAPSCPIHQRPLEWRDEPNLFFRLSRYQDQIEQLVRREGFIAPISRRREVENFVARGLRDFSISRIDLPWGIPVPGHPGHTFYVWFDALVGYLSALLDPGAPISLEQLPARGWPAQLHVIGKDILRFHAVFWPAMLMSADLPLPERVFGHGFLTREGQKMGKSLGNVLNPEELLERCGRDAVRWYLLRDIPFGEDGDFQQKRFIDLVNNDLANTIGNLLNRTVSMARKWFGGAIPPSGEASGDHHPLAVASATAARTFDQAMEGLDFRGAAEAVLKLAETANGFLNDQAPWIRMKQPDELEAVGADLYAVLESCRWIGVLLIPLLPDLSARMLEQLACPSISCDAFWPASAALETAAAASQEAHGAWQRSRQWGVLPSHGPLPSASPVMQRLELPDPL